MRFTSAGDILIPTKAPTDQLSAVQPPKLTTPVSAPAPTSAQDDDDDDLELDLDNMNLDDIDTSVSTFFIISFKNQVLNKVFFCIIDVIEVHNNESPYRNHIPY